MVSNLLHSKYTKFTQSEIFIESSTNHIANKVVSHASLILCLHTKTKRNNNAIDITPVIKKTCLAVQRGT